MRGRPARGAKTLLIVVAALAVGLGPSSAVAPAASGDPARTAGPTPVSSYPTTITPEQYGAAGNGISDDTAALQRALDAVPAGGALRLRSNAVYRYTDVLQARVAGETVVGNATLLATNPERSSFWVTADHVALLYFTLHTVNVAHRYYEYEQMGVRLAGVRYAVVRGLTVVGAAAAGVYVGASCCTTPVRRSSQFRIDNVRVVASAADGIHVTSGSAHGAIDNVETTATGDDGVAVVSYEQDQAVCSDIAVSRVRVLGTTGGRGVSIVGGTHIRYSHVYVQASSAAGLYIANEGAPFNTASVDRVEVSDVVIDGANTNPTIDHGAVLIYSARADHTVESATISGVQINATRLTAPWEVGVHSDGGAVRAVVFDSFTITGLNPPLVANVASRYYSARNWTVNGQFVGDPG